MGRGLRPLSNRTGTFPREAFACIFAVGLSHLGLPETHPQAALSQHRQFVRLKVLRNEAELLHFLQADARYPVSGKPTHMLKAIGSVGRLCCRTHV